MQKNLSCRNIKEAQKNMMYFSLSLVIVNLLFLCLGALLYSIAGKYGINFTKPDDLFPAVVLSETLGFPIILIFILGLIAAAYSSADSALTSLTTSFCVDILEIDIKDSSSIIRRKYIHLLFSIIILVVILILHAINDQSIISSIFSVAGYTYGPLLGLYFFGLFTSYNVNDKLVPYIAIIAPALSYIIQTYYSIGFEILIVNALLVCLGLFVTKENKLLSAR